VDVNLVRFKSDGEPRSFPVKGGRCLFGRQKTCDLYMPMSSVSREHCELFIKGDAVFIRDLGSRNGTFHNEEPVEGEVQLEAGDRIAVGPIVFTLQIDGEPEHIEPPLMEAPTLSTNLPAKETSATASESPKNEDSAVDLTDLIAQVEADDSSVFDIDFYLDDDAEDT
jgi:pSer/pThr/pTyr-binding forkhead associated (FHA) protein